MDCNCNKEKRSYHFHVCEVVEGKVQDVMSIMTLARWPNALPKNLT